MAFRSVFTALVRPASAETTRGAAANLRKRQLGPNMVRARLVKITRRLATWGIRRHAADSPFALSCTNRHVRRSSA